MDVHAGSDGRGRLCYQVEHPMFFLAKTILLGDFDNVIPWGEYNTISELAAFVEADDPAVYFNRRRTFGRTGNRQEGIGYGRAVGGSVDGKRSAEEQIFCIIKDDAAHCDNY